MSLRRTGLAFAGVACAFGAGVVVGRELPGRVVFVGARAGRPDSPSKTDERAGTPTRLVERPSPVVVDPHVEATPVRPEEADGSPATERGEPNPEDRVSDEAAAQRLCDERVRLLQELGLLAPQTDSDVREQRAITAMTSSYGIPPDERRLALLEALDLHVRYQRAVEEGDAPLAQAIRERAKTVLTEAYGFEVDSNKAFRHSNRHASAKDVEIVQQEAQAGEDR